MAYNTFLADRINQVLKDKGVKFVAKEMMGGITYLVDGKMCVGIVKDDLMARVEPDIYEECLQKEGCREMDFTKRPLKGYVFIEPLAYDMDEDLEYWIQLALDFNPKAKASKKRK